MVSFTILIVLDRASVKWCCRLSVGIEINTVDKYVVIGT